MANPIPKVARKRGDATRQRIVASLTEFYGSSSSWPTLDELVPRLHISKTNLLHHLEWLKAQNIIIVREADRTVRRQEVVLTQRDKSHSNE